MKKLSHILKGIAIKLREKTYNSNGTRCKYLIFDNPKSNILIVGFQACASPPVYNYVRSLNGINAVRLYIKDDYAKDH